MSKHSYRVPVRVPLEVYLYASDPETAKKDAMEYVGSQLEEWRTGIMGNEIEIDYEWIAAQLGERVTTMQELLEAENDSETDD